MRSRTQMRIPPNEVHTFLLFEFLALVVEVLAIPPVGSIPLELD